MFKNIFKIMSILIYTSSPVVAENFKILLAAGSTSQISIMNLETKTSYVINCHMMPDETFSEGKALIGLYSLKKQIYSLSNLYSAFTATNLRSLPTGKIIINSLASQDFLERNNITGKTNTVAFMDCELIR
jgi:hypothetical protein